MNEHRDINDLIADGWCIHMNGIRPINDAPFDKSIIHKIIEETGRTATHIGLMFNPKLDKKMAYVIKDKKILSQAIKILEEQSKTVGFKMRIVCEARSTNEKINLSEAIGNISNILKLKVSNGETDNQFYVFYDYEGESKEQGKIILNNLDKVLLALSLQNRVSFKIKRTSWGEYSISKPISGWPGAWILYCDVASESNIELVNLAYNSKINLDILQKIRTFYGHSSMKDQIIFASSLIDTLFAKSKNCLLSEQEQQSLLEKISSNVFQSEHEKKISEIKQIINNPDRLPQKTKNERITDNIFEFFDEQHSDILKNLRGLSKVRQKIAHTTDEVDDIEMQPAIQFVERLLFSYLNHLKKVKNIV